MREWENAPAGLLETILEYRAFAAAKVVVDQDPKDLPPGPMFELVREIEFALAAESLEATERLIQERQKRRDA